VTVGGEIEKAAGILALRPAGLEIDWFKKAASPGILTIGKLARAGGVQKSVPS
jgi:hypothetical protein